MLRVPADLTAVLVFQITSIGLQKPQTEVRFHPERRWRFDLAYPDRMLAIEVEGGIFRRGGGAHSHPKGILRDIEKYNAASIAGWRVIRVTPDMIKSGEALLVVERAYWASKIRPAEQILA